MSYQLFDEEYEYTEEEALLEEYGYTGEIEQNLYYDNLSRGKDLK